jgi:hypothetical protein
MKKEKKELTPIHGFRFNPELWKRIIARKTKTNRTTTRELHLLIEAGFEKLEKEENENDSGKR